MTSLTQREVDRLEAPIGLFLATLTKQEFLEGALRKEMLGYPVSTVADIFKDRQLAARSFWTEVIDATTGKTMQAPGGFAIVNGSRIPAGRRAPRAGDHNDEILTVKEGGV